MIKDKVEAETELVHKDDTGNILAIRFSFDTHCITLINIYGPNDDEPNFFHRIETIVNNQQEQNDHIIIAGDYNLVLNQAQDTHNYRQEHHRNAKRTLKQIMQEQNLVDIWRLRNPEKKQFTWFNAQSTKMARLDNFVISSHTQEIISDCSIQNTFRSDHSIISLECKDLQEKRGRGLWKFNLSLLHDQCYINAAKQVISETVEQYAVPVYNVDFVQSNAKDVQFTVNDSLFFETLLMNIRSHAIYYSKKLAKERKKEENILLENIKTLEGNLQFASEQHRNDLSSAKARLEDIRANQIQGMIIRSRCTWHEHGERSSKYFCGLEKQHWRRKSIPLIVDSDKTIQGQKNILQYLTDHYTKVMGKQHEPGNDLQNMDRFLENNVELKLTELQRASLETPIVPFPGDVTRSAVSWW